MKALHLQNTNWQNRLVRTLGIIGLTVGLHPLLAQAGTVSVGDATTLVSAIASCADGDTINLTNNIMVSGQVSISAKGLTIEGNNYSISVPVPGLNDSGVVNASPSTFRVFSISASGKTNTLRNLTVKGGNPTSNGGGILNSGGTLVLQSVTVAQSGGSGASGGGLVNNSGTVYLRDCNISRNAANYGGGFLNYSTLFIERCTFSENRSLSSSGGGGLCLAPASSCPTHHETAPSLAHCLAARPLPPAHALGDGAKPRETRQKLPLDTLRQFLQDGAAMNESEKQFSFTRAVLSTSGRAKNQIPTNERPV